ncbi:MAG TPA: cupin domain-containing protein [Baekduia sp.]|uniref:cupin domain-containing protein n=1 Tax=Baekduia sp. TaxID=2600305 RepID=UPI002C12B590|nr:cupin domain-containing protein [Baekduia sp.]HMJ34201.1 cupin domain-containing protein [Baekduia sp.]
MREAKLTDTETGRVPEGEGWFVLNLRDARWETTEGGGAWVSFEAEGVPNQIGAGAHLLPPGESTGFYHREENQEGFLVLSGECRVIVEGEERMLRQWDFFHCPSKTGHIMIGGSEQPCVLFMFGNRRPGAAVDYEVEPLAAQYGASVAQATSSAKEAYGPDRVYTPVRAPWPED